MKSVKSFTPKRVITVKPAKQLASLPKQKVGGEGAELVHPCTEDPAIVANAPAPDPCKEVIPQSGDAGNLTGLLGPGDECCGLSPTTFYPSQIVQQFTAIVTAEQFAVLLRSVARNCPRRDDDSVNIITLNLEVLCPGKYQVKFVPGNTLDLDILNPDLPDPFTGSIQEPGDIFRASLALQQAGIPLKYQSTEQVLAVFTDVGVSGVYADIVERFYGNVDLLSIYGNDETGFLVIIQVAAEQLFFAQQILNTPREDLSDPKVLHCYECQTLPSPTPGDNCNRPPLNCRYFYPCCKVDCKKACRKGDGNSDSDDEKPCKKPKRHHKRAHKKHHKKGGKSDSDSNSDTSDDEDSQEEGSHSSEKVKFDKEGCGCKGKGKGHGH